MLSQASHVEFFDLLFLFFFLYQFFTKGYFVEELNSFECCELRLCKLFKHELVKGMHDGKLLKTIQIKVYHFF